jgi:phosphoglucomutase
MDTKTQQRVQSWLQGNYDPETKAAVLDLQKNHPDELNDAFYQTLEFGTGGLRGIMGVGTNRINQYTVGMATQGYANYLKAQVKGEIRVAIAHDCRNNSRKFAEITANVMGANGIKVFLFDSLRPTPELSFAIRQLHCHGGVVCTASHNPKEYNGYKAYWNDGGQLVPPHDKNVMNEVAQIESLDEVKWGGGESNITIIGKEMDEAFIEMSKSLSVYPDIIARQHDLSIVYTPIHGSGIMLVPDDLKAYGFTNVHIVQEQATPDGNFPTVVNPNPEEAGAMALGLKLAASIDADIVAGTDPDSDRVGIGVKDHKGRWVLMNGNQTAVLAFNYLMEARKAKGIATPNDMVVKTIVTSDMINVLAGKYGVKCYDVLTGFKWIAELIKEKEGKEHYIIGGEESYGLMVGDQVRDKDAVTAVAILCEMAAYEKQKGRTLYDKLIDLYKQCGFYKESLISLTKKGMHGQEEIAAMMDGYRQAPPSTIAGVAVKSILDYQRQIGKNLENEEIYPLALPKSNVLQFNLADGTKISARPSGTEPKIKFYFSVNAPLADVADYEKVEAQLDAKIKAIIEDMKLQ